MQLWNKFSENPPKLL